MRGCVEVVTRHCSRKPLATDSLWCPKAISTVGASHLDVLYCQHEDDVPSTPLGRCKKSCSTRRCGCSGKVQRKFHGRCCTQVFEKSNENTSCHFRHPPACHRAQRPCCPHMSRHAEPVSLEAKPMSWARLCPVDSQKHIARQLIQSHEGSPPIIIRESPVNLLNHICSKVVGCICSVRVETPAPSQRLLQSQHTPDCFCNCTPTFGMGTTTSPFQILPQQKAQL